MRRFIKVKSEIKVMGSGRDKAEKCVVFPEFLITGKDIMRKGGNFYAILDPKTGMWSTNHSDLYRIIDEELYSYADKNYKEDGFGKRRDSKGREVIIKNVDDSSTRVLIEFNKWFNSLPPNHNYVPLDSDLTFLSDEVTPEMYRSKRLEYDLSDGSTEAYEKIMGTLYSEDDRKKLEWAIGSILSGDSKKIEKMVVLYGKKGTGKSTVIDLIEVIFKGYWHEFVAEDLANKSHQFATAAFKDNPLVAIQDDGSLAKIDSPRINEIVSHRVTQINEKNTKQYSIKPNAMLFLATNDLVDIHDTNMGIARRLLDVYPTYQLLPVKEYRRLVNQMMKFEVPSIAKHCLSVYKELGKEYYTGYEPSKMIDKTNYLRNFIFDYEDELTDTDPITRDIVYAWYCDYCDKSGFIYKRNKVIFVEQLREYYETYEKVKWFKGKTHRHVFSGFKGSNPKQKVKEVKSDGWLQLNFERSIFDEWCKDKGFPAQYANKYENPQKEWKSVKTTLSDIDTSKLHYINIPEEEHHIRIDFDIRNEKGEKDLKKNIEAANTFPPTYAEISKSGGGVHLHYFYDGDVGELDKDFADGIEIKTDIGNQGCRRKLTKCNDLPMATINTGLPKRKKKDMIDDNVIKDERRLKNTILKTLRKEVHSGTKPSVDFIYKILEDAYNSGMIYDVSDLKDDVLAFANNSTNHANYCVNLVHKIKFKSEKEAPESYNDELPLIFYDVEVFPNLFLINWKYAGKGKSITRMINPSVQEVYDFVRLGNLVDFNGRRYDRHMLWGRIKGLNNLGLYDLSQRIISGDKNAFYRDAYKIGYTDVYDFSNTKQSLKKWEIALGIHHQELGMKWDEPVPEDRWEEVAAYCDNDVLALEEVFNHLHEDWTARKILALLSGLSVNDTTNSHTTRIIIGTDEHAQDLFEYTDLSEEFPGYEFNPDGIDPSRYSPGAKIVTGKSLYMGEDPGEGGYVYAEPGMYYDVALLDIASMHPNSARNLNIFGPYQARYNALIDARLAIKHGDYEEALRCLLIINPNVEKELREYLSDAKNAKALAYALKIPINSVYGLTSAKFDNKLKDPRNIDNIVAKRGALFMINLKHEVQKKGFNIIFNDEETNIYKTFTVGHIKTDSIKIPNATPEIIQFVMDYGKKYGYSFEHEATYKKMCLVNDAVYVAQYADGEHEFELSTGEKIMTDWTATGAEFQHPYIFKKLFAKAPITFNDYCETKSVQKGDMYLDMNEGLSEDEHKMVFVGRVGSFVPVTKGGGLLYRVQNEKNYAVSGTKGYRWLEAEVVKNLGKQDDIDFEYFEKLSDAAYKHISEFGDFDRFVNDPNYDAFIEKYLTPQNTQNDEIPFEEDFMNKPKSA